MQDEPALDVLTLAFAWHAATEVLKADANVDQAELSWVAERFPKGRLQAAGLVDDAGEPTARFHEARDLALVRLHDALTEIEKLDLLATVVEASAADGVVTPEEADALSAFARMLGLRDQSWLVGLEARIAAGRVRRDDTAV
ncbi:MAG: TerB family tellurite resistance protein [Myxococcota bacterium]